MRSKRTLMFWDGFSVNEDFHWFCNANSYWNVLLMVAVRISVSASPEPLTGQNACSAVFNQVKPPSGLVKLSSPFSGCQQIGRRLIPGSTMGVLNVVICP